MLKCDKALSTADNELGCDAKLLLDRLLLIIGVSFEMKDAVVDDCISFLIVFIRNFDREWKDSSSCLKSHLS